eukprot:CAMPEP_0179147618 /NCGR_PEP_ID=MMETSP0796-20121207/71371_1 /TAXON_ID=73915 /ORGANISM="Pyrodinium bahamense, Strain pbaha01" /LENGTH=52 /DNA_ID=CAMNT_0020848231 /DNA_START=1 /DNA_END=156 /DNA_ORIENTATION=-
MAAAQLAEELAGKRQELQQKLEALRALEKRLVSLQSVSKESTSRPLLLDIAE